MEREAEPALKGLTNEEKDSNRAWRHDLTLYIKSALVMCGE